MPNNVNIAVGAGEQKAITFECGGTYNPDDIVFNITAQGLGTPLYYVEGPSTDGTAGTWTGTISGLTAYYDGLTVLYVPNVAGASTTTLNINGLGAVTCYYNSTSSKLTTHHPVGVPILLTYKGGKWMRADYDSNSNTVPSAHCTTAAATAAKTATCTYYSITGPHYLHVLIRYSNTKNTALTLNVNSVGAYPIYINGEPSSASNYTLPAGTYIVYFDGSNYQFRTDGVIPGTIMNANTVNNHTVNTDVPSNAVFTDTTYGLAGNGEDGLMSAADKDKLDDCITDIRYNGSSVVTVSDGIAAISGFKPLQTAVSDPAASSTTSTTFIDSISQDTNGVITVTKKTVPVTTDTNTTLSGIAYCNTAAGTAAKTATMPGFALSSGQRIILHLATASTVASATLSVNSTAAKNVRIGGANTTASNFTEGYWLCNYDGTYWQATKIYLSDTDTKVTSSANHYTPSTASGNDKSASASGATAAWGIDVVKGVTLNTDGKGHVTGISVTSGKIPANPDTDVKVKATAKTDNVNYKILATASASPTSGNATEAVYDTDITMNPSTNTIAANISGNAVTATTAQNYDTSTGTIKTALEGKEDGGNKVTSWQNTPDDTHYPSEKLVKDSLDNKANNTESVYYVNGSSSYTAYSSSSTYTATTSSGPFTEANSCVYSGIAYYCSTTISTPESWKSGHWTVIPTPVLTGTIEGLTALYTGLKIAYKFNVRGGSSSTYLNINNLGNKYIRRNDGNLTTHIPINSVAFLAYDGTYWRWADYDSDNYFTSVGAYCSTSASTAAKTATSTNHVNTAGESFLIRFTNTNSYSGKLTLNIASQGAKDIWINGAVSSASNCTLPAGEYWCHYDGSVYHIWTDGTAQFTKLKAGTITGDLVGNADTATTAAGYTNDGAIATALGGKQDTLTTQTAYTSKGSATKVPQITTNSLGQVTGITEVTISGVTPASHAHGNITNEGGITASGVTIANGDSLVIVDSSETNKLVSKASITFDGSTATQYLSKKGTWESVPTDTNTTLSGVAYCSTGASTAAKAATMPGFALSSGQRIILQLVTTSSVASATLNVNSTGAKTVMIDGAATTASNFTAGYWLCNYDGTYWQATKIYLSDTTYNFSGTTFYSGNNTTAEHDANNAVKNGNYYYSSNGPATSLGASSTDGALYVQSYSDSWVGQIAQDYRNGRLFVRGKNNGTWQNWSRIAMYSEIPTDTNTTLSGVAYCSTSAGTAAKAATMPGFALASGQRILLYLSTSSTVANATLNVNSTGAKTVRISSAATTATNFTAGYWLCYYDGTYWNASKFSIPHQEAYLEWGGKNLAGAYSPIDASMVGNLGANRTAFVSAAKVTVQYSRDAGATWTDYDTTDAKKTGFFTDFNGGFTIGNSTTSNRADENCLLRVVLATNGASVYTVFNKFVVYISTSGSSGCWCTIDARLQTNVANNVDTWAVFANHIDISGYPGYSVINTSGLTTYGNTASSQYGEVRFTFGCTSHTSTSYAGLQVYGVNCYGGFGWNTPSTLAKNGHLYSYDMSKNATFPAKVTATGFVKSGGTSAQFLKADGSVDTNTYSVSTHAHGNITNAGALQSSDITIANGDKLVVTDASDSNKVARTSVAFDGSTTTQFLSKKGTWETDSRVTQTVTASSNTAYRPLILGNSYSDAATFSPTTVTDVTYATHLAKFKPSTGILAVVGLNKMTTSGTVSTGSNSTLWNTNGGTTSIATVATSGSYSDLSNTPTNLSDFTNDSNYITDIQHDGTSVVTVTNGVAAISGFKTTQTAVSDPTASSTTSTTFIDSISQDTNGVITATKKTLPTATTTVAGIAKLGASGGSAAYSHTHGNITSGGALQTTDITIANGDKLVVTDASSSNKVARASIAFDGSTTTQALTKKGTFETFLQSHQDISGKEDTSNKVSSWSSTTTDEHYPSEKLVKDSLDLKAPLASPALTGTPTAPTASAGTNTTQVATTAFVKAAVDTAIADVADALIYKGTIAGGSTGNYGALTVAANKGDLYKVSAAGKVNGVSVEVGDMLICNSDSTAAATSSNYTTIAAKWDVIQTNIEGYVLGPSSSVNNRVAVFDGTTGKTIKDSGYTIATSVPSGAVFTDTKVTSSANHYTPSTVSGNDKSASASGATAAWGIDVVKGVTLNTDGKGHVTGISVTSGKIPANPDTNTTLSGVAFCNTAAGTAAKTATMPGFALSNGQRIILHLATASTVANATLNVNSTTAKTVMIDGAATTASNFTAGYWLCNYDGTYWQAEKVDFTDTKVTSSANHYTPATASGNDKSASASGATAAWSIDVVKGVTLNTDGKGHVTGISVTSGKIPSNPNTDTKVKATAKTDNVNYKILATASASPTSGNATEAVYDTDITLNPSTNTIAANISGDAATASAAKSGSTLATTIAGKQDALTTQTAYTSKGSATKVPQITTNSLGQVTGITEVTISGVTPAAHNHSEITTAGDNRSVATTPNNYSNKLIFQGLKTNSVIGSPSSDSYSFVVGLRGWSDSSGGNAHELAFNNTGLFIRRGATTAWGNWEKVLTSANIPTATSSVAGITTVGASDGAAAYDHTHDNYITDIYYNGATIASISNGIADISNYVGSSGGLAEYGHAHGNITNEGGITASGVTIANGDSLVIVDSSDTNKLMAKTTITFDGSTTSKYLSQKGTWVSIPTDNNTTLSGIAYCNTGASTAAKAATMPGFALSSGQRIILHLATASTVASATLNVNSTGAKNVRIDGANTTASNFTEGYWLCNYDGTYWQATKIYLTDTDTKVTSSANHYTPATASGNDKSASASGATAAWGIDVVKGVTLNTDGKGHVTGISVTSGKIPANPNTDTTLSGVAYCNTAAGTAAKAATMPGFALSSDQRIILHLATASTVASATLNVNSTGAKTVKINGANTTATNFIAGYWVCNYDGTNWVCSRLNADVKQGATTTANYRKILLSGPSYGSAAAAVSESTDCTYQAQYVEVKPSTGELRAKSFVKASPTNATGILLADGTDIAQSTFATAGHTHSGYKTTQTAVSDPTASSTTSTTFIDSISQDSNGVITVTKKTVPVTTDTNTTLSGIAYCNTGASTAAKAATMPGFALSSGQRIILHLVTASTVASATLNVNSTGAKTVKIDGANTTASNFTAGYWLCNYDGSYWQATKIYLSDTDTKVTSSANHYTPATASGNDKSASASGATAAWGIDVVKGVTLNTDGKGHVTGISVTSGKIPSNPNTDTKVTQTYAAASGYTNWRPLVIGNSNSATEGFTPSTATDTTFVFDTITCQPSSGTIRAGKFKVSGGTSSQFLKADGSTDSNGYIHDIQYDGASVVTVSNGVATISGFKTTQTAVSDPTASSTTSTTFIDSISQDTNGVITVTKKTVPVTTNTNTTLSGVAYCDTAGSTKAKAATMPGFALSSGQRIILHLVNDSTVAAATLSVNSTAAKNVRIGGANTTASNFTAGYWLCNYDGTYWQATKIYLTDTTYPTATSSVAGITTVGASGGAAAYSHTHSYLPLSGGTMTGNITMSSGKGVILTNYTTSSSFSDSDRRVPFSLADTSNISLTSTDSTKGLTFNPATGALKTGSFVKLGGTSSQFLKADGSTDSNSYISGIYYDGTSIATVSNGIADISGAVGVSGGLAAYSHSHSNYVAKTGDTMTGDLTISESGPAIIFRGATAGKQEYRMLQSDSNDAFKIQNRDRGSSSSYTDMMWVKKNYFYLPNLFVAGTDTATSPHVLDMYAPNMSVNRLFGLPASCIIIEVSQDGGSTWQDGGFTDSEKQELLTTDMNVGLEFPKKNGANSTDTRMRITITNCKYNVPDGTPETQKYSYWNNTYYDSTYFRCPFCGFRIMYYTPGKGDIQIYTSNMFSPDTWTEIASKTGIQSSSEKLYICPTDTKYMYANINSPSYAHHIRFVFTPTTVNATYAHAVRMIEMYAKFMGSATGSSSTMMTYGTPYRVDKDANMVLRNGTTTPPKLIFERGSGWDSYWDWAVYAKSNGALEIGYSANGNNWSPVLTTLTSTGSGVNVSKLTITNGTSSQFLKADGTLDSNVYVKRPSAGNGTSGQVLSTNGDGTTSWVSQSGGSSGYVHDGNSSHITMVGPGDITAELGPTYTQYGYDVNGLDTSVNMGISIGPNAYMGCHTFVFVNTGGTNVTITPQAIGSGITMVNPTTSFTVYPFNTQLNNQPDYVTVKIYYDVLDFHEQNDAMTITTEMVRIEVLNSSDISAPAPW